jgi:hypothetical protein
MGIMRRSRCSSPRPRAKRRTSKERQRRWKERSGVTIGCDDDARFLLAEAAAKQKMVRLVCFSLTTRLGPELNCGRDRAGLLLKWHESVYAQVFGRRDDGLSRAEATGGRKAPRHEIAGVEAGTGLRGYGGLSVGSILGVVDGVAGATRFAGSVPCALRGNGAAGVLRDEVMCFRVVIG